MKMKPLVLSCALTLSLSGLAQDEFFLNTNQSLLFLNPSFAGSNGLVRNQNGLRSSYPFLPVRTLSYASSIDWYIPGLNAGLALSWQSQDYWHGILKYNHFAVTYAKYFYLLDTQVKLIPSLQLDYTDMRLDRANLTFGSMLGPGVIYQWGTGYPSPGTRFLDINSGLLVSARNFFFGLSLFHVNQPDEGLLGTSRVPTRSMLHASYNQTISENALISYSARFSKQGAANYFQLAANQVFYRHLLTGIGLTSDAKSKVYASLGYRNDYLSTIFSYGSSLEKGNIKFNNCWELMCSFNLRPKNNRASLTAFEQQ